MKNGKLQIALVGCGGIANNKHMPALSKLNDVCEIVAFCDIIKERAEKAAKEFGQKEQRCIPIILRCTKIRRLMWFMYSLRM
jgi:predicted dehydrogenase